MQCKQKSIFSFQFAIVHYFTKNGSGEVYFNDTSSSSEESDEDADDPRNAGRGRCSSSGGGGATSGSFRRHHAGHSSSTAATAGGSGSGCSSAMMMGQMQQMAIIDIPPPPPLKMNSSTGLGSGEDSPSVIPGCPQTHAQPRLGFDPHQHPRRDSAWNFCQAHKRRRHRIRHKQKMELENVNSVSKVDKFARVFFPLSFLCINVFYWYSYLYKSSDEAY